MGRKEGRKKAIGDKEKWMSCCFRRMRACNVFFSEVHTYEVVCIGRSCVEHLACGNSMRLRCKVEDCLDDFCFPASENILRSEQDAT